MGEAIFYGANDNASGIAILIDMASYFKNNPQQYSIVFVAFGGEEAGLLGSLNYVKRPAISLAKTKFVFNMDLMGSGEKGATIINGSVFKDDFDKLFIDKNDENNPKIKNADLFQRRIIGAISYYRTSGTELFPELLPINIQYLKMTDHQLAIYDEVREKERIVQTRIRTTRRSRFKCELRIFGEERRWTH